MHYLSNTIQAQSVMLQLKVVALILIWWSSNAVAAPDAHLVNIGCSTFNASDLRSFFANINESFSDMREDIRNQSKHFGTIRKARGEVLTYAMFQCRNYLSKNDCLSCFNTATTQIRNCSGGNGARVIYDGCFLRYTFSIIEINKVTITVNPKLFSWNTIL